MWRWCATYHWKVLDEVYNFILDPISIKGLHTKLWAPKVMGVPIVGISRLLWEFRDSHLGVPTQNDIWVLVPWLDTKYTIRGKVVASPKLESWWILWICVCPWFVRAPKCCNYALTNLLFSLCKFVWVSEMLVNLPNPIPKLQHAPLPPKYYEPGNAPNSFSFHCLHLWTPKLLWAKECAPTPSPSTIFTFEFEVESIKELGGVSLILLW